MNEFTAEFLGTFVLLLLGNGVVANVVLKDTKGNNSGWIVITAGWAMAVFVAVTIAAEASGAHLNPAVTIGLAAAGKFEWAKVGTFILAQMLGAMAGTTAVWLAYRDHYNRTEDAAGIRGTFCNTPAIANTFNNVFTEIIGTFVLVLAVLYFAAPAFEGGGLDDVKVGLGAIGALPVAFTVFAIGLSLGGPTGYAINPARDLGPRIMHQILPIPSKGDSGWGYSWIPVIGPILGGLAAAGLFLVLG
ncbi:MAG: MIP/aquaporin family protein [Bacteroidota bacterium]